MGTLNFAASAGLVEAPFVRISGGVSQPEQTALASSGKASYRFKVPAPGRYIIRTKVDAPGDANNSLYVAIDGEPADPADTWDILSFTNGLEFRTVTLRGSGTFNTPQFNPKIFQLTGEHTLIIRGREKGVLMSDISITPADVAPKPPTGLSVGR